MSQDSGPTGRPNHSGSQSAMTTMLSWLGFFLLVFAVAGVAFYLAGSAEDPAGSTKPAAITQKAN